MVPDLREILGFGPENISELSVPADEEWLLAQKVATTDAVRARLATVASLRIDGQAMLRCVADVLTLETDNRVISEHEFAQIPSYAWDCDKSIKWDVSEAVFARQYDDVVRGCRGVARIVIEGLRFACEDLTALSHVIPEFSGFMPERSVPLAKPLLPQPSQGAKAKAWWPLMVAVVREVEAGKLGEHQAYRHATEHSLWQSLIKDVDLKKHLDNEGNHAPGGPLKDKTLQEQVYALYRAIYNS